MQRIATLSATVLIVLGFTTPPVSADVIRKSAPPPAASAKSAIANPSGLYASAESNLRIAVRPDGVGEVESSSGWNAVGFFRNREFVGMMRDLDDLGNPMPEVPYGRLQFTVRDDGSIDAVLAPRGGSLRQDEHWKPKPKEVIAPPRPQVRVTPPSTEEPEPGAYVYVEELPEAITKVPPTYPPAMREAGIQGTVVVKALVGKDGRVSRTMIVKSISETNPAPELDAAAAAAVRQWIFKPARSREGATVAVWVDVPIRFSLH